MDAPNAEPDGVAADGIDAVDGTAAGIGIDAASGIASPSYSGVPVCFEFSVCLDAVSGEPIVSSSVNRLS